MVSDCIIDCKRYLRRAGQREAERYLYIIAGSPCVNENRLATIKGHVGEE
jgi:hypothetical protein